MTPEQIIGAFLYGVTQLRVDDDGCAPSDYADVITVANLCHAVRKAIAGRELDSVDMLLLRDLVMATEMVVTTFVVSGPDNRDIMRRWMLARSAYLANELAAL